MVFDGDLQVLEVPVLLKHVGHIGRHVQDVVDAILLQLVTVRRVLGVAQVQVRQHLGGEGGHVRGAFQVNGSVVS